MDNLKKYFNLPKSIYILFLARIINSIGSFVYPLLAILLTAKLGFSEEVSGRITTIAITAGGLGMLIGGKLADKFGRKKVMVISSLLGAASFIICAFLGTSRNAMVTDQTNKVNRQNAFSLLYLGTNIGMAIGPLMAGFLINRHLVLFFLIDALTTVISLIPVMIFVKETLPTEKQAQLINENDMEKAEKGSVITALFKRPLLVIFTIVSIIYTLVYAQYSFGLPLFVNNVLGIIKGPKIYGSLMTVNAIVVILFTLFIISFMGKIKPIINITIAGILFAFGFGMLYFSKFIFLFVISTFIWTLGEIIFTVNSSVVIANNSPISHRGRFNAVISFVQESGYAIAPLLTGLFIAHWDIQNLWWLIFLISLTGSILMFSLFLLERHKTRKIKIN